MTRRLLTISHSYVVALNRAVPNAIARQGWDVTIVAPPHFPGDLRPIALERETGEAAWLEAVPIRSSRRVHWMRWGRQLRQLLDRDWDIVHAWEEPYVLAGAQVARWKRRGKLVFATFQNISKRYPAPVRWLERYAMARADAWIAFGTTVEQALGTRHGYAARPHRVIPPGIDVNRFTIDAGARATVRQTSGFGPADVVVGFAGRFVPEKGVRTLVEALDRVRVPWKALLIGGGALEPELRRWAAAAGRARIVTDATHGQMAQYLNAMDLIAVPSRTTPRWREQFGRVIVEAMACGVPVVASDSGEVPHVVGDAGLLVGEADIEGWVRAMERLIGDEELRERLAVRGRARAAEFSVDASARRHVAFFEELLAA